MKRTEKTSACKIDLYQRPVTEIRGGDIIVQASFTLQNFASNFAFNIIFFCGRGEGGCP
jgi:hypothetical protein